MEPLSGAPRNEIELARVERELAALWAQAAPDDPGAEPAVLRACSLNLLVLAGSPVELEQARPVARQTTLAHPSRILLVAPEGIVKRDAPGSMAERSAASSAGANAPRPIPPASNGVGAQISTFCHVLGGGGRHVCCEEITLLARGAAAGRLREAVLPLLVPDLPVYLWLPGHALQATGYDQGHPEGSRPDTLARHPQPVASPGDWRLASDIWHLADEVIWSARGAADELPLPPLRSRPLALFDLDWLRLQPWRELTAQWFDPTERAPLLERLEAVEIDIAGPAGARPGAGWLWVGWLASRLGWEYRGEAAGPEVRRLVGPGGPVTARVRTVEAATLDTGEPLAVRLHVSSQPELLLLERLPADDPAELSIASGGGRCVRLGRRDEAALLGEALDGPERDRVYETAWETAVRLRQG